jgi:uncharacterized membrane protein YebE (DUF533 family)
MKNKYFIWLSVMVVIAIIAYYYYNKMQTEEEEAAAPAAAPTKPQSKPFVHKPTNVAPTDWNILISAEERRTR